MPVVLGTDLGTTTITALALDTDSGDILARSTAPNRAETTGPAAKAAGRSEWDAPLIAATACDCLRAVAGQLAGRRHDLAGLGITGQQHGVVLVDQTLAQGHFALLVEPHLAHIEQQQDASELREDAQLLNESGEVLLRQRIVERLVPCVEPDLRVGGRAHDCNEADEQQHDRAALSRRPKRRGHPQYL